MPGVSQISPPIRIVLGAAIAFIAVYMVFLRPKPEATPAPAPAVPAGNVHTGKPAVTSLGKAVEKAQAAAAATTAQQTKEGEDAGVAPSSGSTSGTAATGSTTGSKTAKAAPAKPARPAIDTAGLPAPVAKAIQERKVLALLFTNRHSADDRAVDRALRSVHHFDGRVFTREVPLSTISRYGRITRGADVQQSPTVVVVDRDLKATTLVGYVDGVTIEQAVVDAMRASGGIFTGNRYLAKVNNACSSVTHDLFALPQVSSGADYPGALRAESHRVDAFVSDIKANPAPARWRGFKRSFLADAVSMQKSFHSTLSGLPRHPSTAAANKAQTALAQDVRPANARMTRLADRHHLVYCGRLG
jgi:hypothetical protein